MEITSFRTQNGTQNESFIFCSVLKVPLTIITSTAVEVDSVNITCRKIHTFQAERPLNTSVYLNTRSPEFGHKNQYTTNLSIISQLPGAFS
jgi:hypothetical protein